MLIAKYNIAFHDAMGSALRILPCEYFRSFEVFRAFNQEEFKSVPLIGRMHRYVLSAPASTRVLTEGNWQSRVGPGSTIAMSALAHPQHKKLPVLGVDSGKEPCPEPACSGAWVRPEHQTWMRW